MTTIFTLALLLNIIYGSAIVWCIKTNPVKEKKPSRKVIRQRRETIEMLDYKLSMDYTKLKAV